MAARRRPNLNPLAVAGHGKAIHAVDITPNANSLVDPMASSVLTDCVAGTTAIRDQPLLQAEHVDHVKVLLVIIQLHDIGHHFGIHAAHRHDAIPVGSVRFQADMGTSGFSWTKPIAIESPDASKMYATFFK